MADVGVKIVTADSGLYQVERTETDANAGVQVGGNKVVGAQQSHIADPSGGATVDAEARTAINSILTTLETHGLVASS